MGLNAKRLAFVREYLVDKNATQAAIRAGYSAKTAAVQGSCLYRDPAVRAEIDARLSKLANKVGVTAEEVIGELKRLAFSDPARVLGENGYLLNLREMPEEVRRTISSVDLSGDGGTKIRFWDKAKALEMLGKHLKLFTDKTELSGEALSVNISINRKVGK